MGTLMFAGSKVETVRYYVEQRDWENRVWIEVDFFGKVRLQTDEEALKLFERKKTEDTRLMRSKVTAISEVLAGDGARAPKTIRE
jgi:hypothetical protein